MTRVLVILLALSWTVAAIPVKGNEENESAAFMAVPVLEDFSLSLRTEATENPTNSPQDPADVGKPGKHKNVWRALAVNFALTFWDSIRYWDKYTKWLEDWQYKLTWEDQKKRFFSLQANRFDSNPFLTNWTHGLSGAIYYSMSRYHNLNALESEVFSLFFSLWWEYVTEWREVISINDNIFSGLGGVSLGEPLFQIGNYFSHRRGLGNRLLGTLFNPVITVNDILGGKNHSWRTPPPAAGKPRFDFYLGSRQACYAGDASGPSKQWNFGLESSLNAIPEYGNPGDPIRRSLRDTFISEVAFDFSLAGGKVEEYRLWLKSVLFGRFSQKLERDSRGRLRGHSFYLGLGSSFDLFKKRGLVYYDKGEYHFDFTAGERQPQPTLYTDKLAVLNLAGPALSYTKYAGDLRFRANLDASFDFALVNALALNAYSESHDLHQPPLKTTLAHYGYYYAFGYTLAAALNLDRGNAQVQGRLRYQRYGSIDGRDRFQSWVQDDCHVSDSRLSYLFRAGYTLPHTPLGLALTFETNVRDGWLREVHSCQVERRFYTQVWLRF